MPLDFINIKPQKGGPPLEFIKIQPQKGRSACRDNFSGLYCISCTVDRTRSIVLRTSCTQLCRRSLYDVDYWGAASFLGLYRFSCQPYTSFLRPNWFTYMYMHIRVSLVIGFLLWWVQISYIFVLEIYIECQIMAIFKDLSLCLPYSRH